MFFYIGIILDGASYNILALVLILAGILELMNRNKISNKSIWIQGLLMFLIFFTKQNIGIIYIISIFVYEIFVNREKILKVFKMLGITLIFSGVTLVIMKLFGILDGFINYAFLGIKEFSNNFIIENFAMFIALLVIYVLVVYSVIYFHKTKKMFAKKVKLLLIFATTNIITLYPFANVYHIKYAFFITILLTIYFFDRLIDKTIFKAKTMDKILVIAMSIGFFVTVQQVRMESYDKVISEDYKIISNFGIDKEEYDLLKIYENYLETTDNNTICISKYSNLFSVLLKDFNGVFDIPNTGNFGKDGVEGVLRKIEEMEDTEFILFEQRNTQEPDEIRDYITKKCEPIYRKKEMDVFYKK